jgi:tRNA G18 (ribose-2'-O)-methylase SpoU
MTQIVLVLDNLRSASNVGSILRTCDAVGVDRVVACGITPYPRAKRDSRDPVVINRNTREIAKTALGAEQTIAVEYFADSAQALERLRREGRTIIALEQSESAHNLFDFRPSSPLALIVGNEVSGVDAKLLTGSDAILELPQRGAKESLNVAVATGIALYQLLMGN